MAFCTKEHRFQLASRTGEQTLMHTAECVVCMITRGALIGEAVTRAPQEGDRTPVNIRSPRLLTEH